MSTESTSPTIEDVKAAAITVRTLLRRHGITAQDQARRLIRERFSDDELAQWRKAREILDASGVIG